MNLRRGGIAPLAGIQVYNSRTVRVVVARAEKNQARVFVSLPAGEDPADIAKALKRMWVKGLRVSVMDSVSWFVKEPSIFEIVIPLLARNSGF